MSLFVISVLSERHKLLPMLLSTDLHQLFFEVEAVAETSPLVSELSLLLPTAVRHHIHPVTT